MLILTPKALEKVSEVLGHYEAENGIKGFIRIGTEKQGCSGLLYTMNWVDSKNEDDEEVGSSIVASPSSLMWLMGVNLDYIITDCEERFEFISTNSDRKKCHCGRAFYE